MQETETRNKATWMKHIADWSAYAAAAGATLAMATNVSASIITATPDLTDPSSSQRAFNVGGDPEVLNLGGESNRTGMSAAAFINAPFLGDPKLHFVTSLGVAKRYLAGQAILGIGRVHTNVDLLFKTTNTRHTSRHGGNFGTGDSSGFIGFVNQAGDLGWLDVKVTSDAGFPEELELIRWAYNNVAGAPIEAGALIEAGASIYAGQTTDSLSAPEPGTEALSLLALGAAGILAFRKRRKELRDAQKPSDVTEI
jgi:hypothetical protein